MTDQEALYVFRQKRADETLSEAEKMVREHYSGASVVNRAYYAMFYQILALFIHESIEVKTSRHSGVIAAFDKEFIRTGKLPKEMSESLHTVFEARQTGDYKDFTEFSSQDADEYVTMAVTFADSVKKYLKGYA
ncbi:MAG: HEPN domain-containing protein [Candidatus Eremiobacteraeota bacterium]|nr:HEPN domain-containing protein [Candidatus Eremiobacteraeota bacterium]